MRKVVFVTVLVFALTLGYAVVRSTADEMLGESWFVSEATDLLGTRVNDSMGEHLGIISDFVKDPEGRISFAILTFGKYEDYGEGGRLVAVPFDALSCSGQDYTLRSSYEQLASSPVFISKDELGNREMAGDIYRYFGLQPYWTEEEMTQHEMTSDFPYDYDYY